MCEHKTLISYCRLLFEDCPQKNTCQLCLYYNYYYVYDEMQYNNIE